MATHLTNYTFSVCLVQDQITFSSRSWSGTPMACHCNYSPLYEQPVGFEQMSRIPCRGIRLIYNHRHFQSPSPAWPRHYGARLQSNFVLSHRKSIRSCLCWRCAPLIFMSFAGIMVCEPLGGEHDLWGACDSLNMICAHVGSAHATEHTHTHTHTNVGIKIQ